MVAVKELLLWTAAAMLPLSKAAALPPQSIAIDRAHREVRFEATVQPTAMARPFGVQGHHAIVWKDGGAKRWALFVSETSDHDVRVALDTLGAHAVEGTPISVFVEWRGSGGRVPLARLISEENRGAPLLDFRYGGNEKYQKEFHSGCIVCLYSCPGGAIGNHAHPIRDSVRDGVVYASVPSRLPPAGTRVTIILKVEVP
jgi:hypothetical protein